MNLIKMNLKISETNMQKLPSEGRWGPEGPPPPLHVIAMSRLILFIMLTLTYKAVGAAAGNMIAIHNVVAASATVGLLGQEGATLRRTILPTIYYVSFVGLIGLIAIYVLEIADPLMPR